MFISLSSGTHDLSDPKQHKQLLIKIKRLKQKELDQIKTQIEQAKVVSLTDLTIYQAVTSEPLPLGDFQYRYFKSSAVVDGNNAYTFINNRFVALPTAENEEYYLYALIDKLLYEHQRNPWKKEPCVSIRRAIEKFLPGSFRGSKDYFRKLLDKKEKAEGTHFGDYLSDDSDSEAEEEFKKLAPARKNSKLTKSRTWRERASYNSYVAKMKLFGNPPTPNFKARPVIHRDENFDRRQANDDLKLLNNKVREGACTPEFLETLETKFRVAQYRGIHYFLNNYDMMTRREHRQLDEIGKAQFSSSVLNQSGTKNYREYLTKISTDPNYQKVLLELSQQLQALLLEMQGTEPVSWNGYVFLNLFYLLQYWYSSDYDSLPTRLADDLKKQDSHFKDFILNTYRSLLSTSDIPYHALKYSYGLKIYEGHKEERIRPQWRKDGRAERPYSGKMYVSLHPITDYLERKPSHLTSLFKDGLCPLSNIIAAERETSFLGYLPEDRVVYQMLAKYPSFKDEYKTIFEYKYGITKALFLQIKNALQKHPPHSEKRKALKRIIGEYFCAYQEVRLIEKANKKAMKQDAVLIYRDENGEFSLYHPDTPTTANKRLSPIIKAKRELYRALAPAGKDKTIKKIDPAKFEQDVEKITYIQDNFDKLRETVSLDELKKLSLRKLKLINNDTLVDLLVEKRIDYNILIKLSHSKLKVICQNEIIDLIADDIELLDVILEFSDEKIALLENEQLLELLENGKVSIEDIDDVDEYDLRSILEYENLEKPLSEGYQLRGLIKKFNTDPLHLSCLTCEDLADLVLEYAPEIPDLLLDYAEENDVDFDWVKKQLGRTDRVLFQEALDDYFGTTADESSDFECGY